MSKHKPLTRVVAEVRGVHYPLISIRENSSGSLIIKPMRAKSNIYDGVYHETLEQKITVHTPSPSGNNMIHHTIRSIDGPDIETHHVTSAITNGGVQLFYRNTFGNLAAGQPTQPVRSKDRTFLAARYEPTKSILHLLVFLAPPKATKDVIESYPQYRRLMIPFRRFSLLVLSAYTYLPSPRQAWLTHYATAPLTIDGVAQGRPIGVSERMLPLNAQRVAISQLTTSHCEAHQRSIDLLREMYPDEGTQNSEEVAILERLLMATFSAGFRRDPFIPVKDAASED